MANGTVTEAPPKQNKSLTIRDRLNQPSMILEMGKAMPAHCKPERMARVALTALTRTPLLAECDQASFFKCLLDLSQWGLEPDGRRAHLIPFRNNKKNIVECQLIIDYKGYVELAYRSGIVKSIHADVVRRGDLFDYNLGHVRRHVPHYLRVDVDKPDKAGDVFAAYCVVELSGGSVKTEILSKEEVELVRKRSRAGASGPWVTDWNEMAKKTAFRRASKWLPLSAEIVEALERDDDKLADDLPKDQPRSFEDIGNLIASSEPTGDAIEGESTETPLSLDEQFAAYQSELLATTEVRPSQDVYDQWFSPDSTVLWTDEHRRLGDELKTKHQASIREARGQKTK